MEGRIRVLLFGKGAGEHNLAWKLVNNSLVEREYVLPSNGWTSRSLRKSLKHPRTEPSSIGPKLPIHIDQEGLKVFAKDIMRKDKIPTTGDGKTFKSLPTGQSQKRIVEGKEGQNIRGVPRPFAGMLFAGIMIHAFE